MADIHELSALDLAAAVRSGAVSPEEVVEHTLERAERIGPTVGAFAHLTPELAREQAAAATRRLEQDREDLPPFLGVPVPVKDLTMVAGQPFEMGSAARSEEHTSELQSRGHLVCRLLLEKNKY